MLFVYSSALAWHGRALPAAFSCTAFATYGLPASLARTLRPQKFLSPWDEARTRISTGTGCAGCRRVHMMEKTLHREVTDTHAYILDTRYSSKNSSIINIKHRIWASLRISLCDVILLQPRAYTFIIIQEFLVWRSTMSTFSPPNSLTNIASLKKWALRYFRGDFLFVGVCRNAERGTSAGSILHGVFGTYLWLHWFKKKKNTPTTLLFYTWDTDHHLALIIGLIIIVIVYTLHHQTSSTVAVLMAV